MMIPTVVGILGPSVPALRNMFEALLSSEPWLHDPEVLPLPYRVEAECNHETSPKLAFGVLESDGVVTPHPPIIRAVREVTKALEAEGHKVFPYDGLLLTTQLNASLGDSVESSFPCRSTTNPCGFIR